MLRVRQVGSAEREIEELRARLAEAEQTLQAIRRGGVDGIAVDGPSGPQIFTLRSADEPYRFLAECMSEGVAYLNPDCTILFCNQRLGEMVGRPIEKLVALPATTLVPAAEREQFQNFLMHGFKGSGRRELQFERSDGHLIPALASVNLIPNEQAPGLCLITTDLRESKRIEENLIRLASIVTNSNDAIVGKTLDGVVTSWNPGAEAIYGYSADEVIGKPIFMVIPPDRRQESEAILDQIKQGKRVHHLETERVRKDGKRVQISLSCSPIKDSKGKVLGASTISRDITQSKRAEHELRISQERLALALQAGRSGSFEWDIANDVTVWSPETEQLYGLSPGAFGGTREDWESLVVPEDRGGMQTALLQSLRTGELVAAWRIRRRDNGEIHWIDARAKVFLDPAGLPVRMVGINVDITDRKRSQEELAMRAEELARSNSELQQFAYVASHDLQEPLRMVASYTQLLRKRYQGQLDADANEFIQYAVDGAVRMQRLINDLLAYSRVNTQGKEFAAVDCERLLEVALSNLKPSIEEAHAVITHDPLPTVQGDETQMGQLFQNLVGNAIKFHGSDPPRIHLAAQPQAGGWRFSVQDNGIGIEPENASRIFVIFQRLHTREEYPGTGMGLAISKKVVERHGGRIWVESQPGKGSTFLFTLPEVTGDKRTAASAAH
jgi:PAS domain S-box-containing protein